MNKKTEMWILIGILIFAFFLRVYSLGSSVFWIDESTSAMASKQIIEKGVPIFDSGLLYNRAYVFHYVSAFFMIFGANEFSARFASVIFGLLTIVLAYFIGKEYSKTGGLISALFFAVFYLEVFYSRQARFYQLFQLLFFLSLYLLYKSKENPKWIYLSLIAFFLTIDTQIEGWVLAPFFLLHILIYNKQKWISIFPLAIIIKKFMPVLGLSTKSTEVVASYASEYFSKASNMLYILILFIPGVIWSFIRNKRLTTLIILPSLITLIGIFSLQTFALRYSYFFVFPLLLYSSLLISFLYEKFGKIMLVALVVLLLIPSNLFFPYTYTNVVVPIDYNFNDISAPETNYRNIPIDLILDLKHGDAKLICLFSSNVEWYLRKPDFVIPFSMNGLGEDQISRNNSQNQIVDRYSGALILDYNSLPAKPYYVLEDYFSAVKLKPEQKANFDMLIDGCELKYEDETLKVLGCD